MSTPTPSRKAKSWAAKSAEERAALYLSMRDHLIEVAALLGDGAEAGERSALLLVSRQFAAAAAAVKHAATLRGACCAPAATFGSCQGHP